MTDLKPCPFCGGEAKWDKDWQVVVCTNCGVSTSHSILVTRKKKEAIGEWNTRANHWHTGAPTEEGWYLIAIRFCNRIEYEARECRRTIDNNGNECMRFDGCNPVIAWQRIEPYKEENNG